MTTKYYEDFDRDFFKNAPKGWYKTTGRFTDTVSTLYKFSYDLAMEYDTADKTFTYAVKEIDDVVNKGYWKLISRTEFKQELKKRSSKLWRVMYES